MRKIFFFILSIGLTFLVGCAQKPAAENLSTPNPTQTMTKTPLFFEVTGYPNGSPMPAKFATKQGGGENASIGVHWQLLPAAQSYAIMFDDRAPAARNWVHWLVVDIPITTTEIPEGASRTDKMPIGSRELVTSWGRAGYDGPQPPVSSGNHEYVATFYALDVAKLSIPENPSRKEFLNAIDGHTLAQESWSGTYERK